MSKRSSTEEEILDFSACQARASSELTEDEEILDFSQVAQPPPRPELSPEQALVRDNVGNTLVIAAPGAGKTEILIQRHERLEAAGLKCLSLTFTVAAANEIRRRIPGAEASTIHAFCFKQCGYEWKGNYPSLLSQYVLQDARESYDEVLVDEAQNLSPLMLATVKAIPKASLFAVGDPYQSCYIGSWAGASSAGVGSSKGPVWDGPALGKRAFERLSETCKVMEIKGNRRSGSGVVKLLETLNSRDLVPLGPKKLNRSLITARTHRRLEEASELLQRAGIAHLLFNRRDSEGTKYKVVGNHPLVDLMVLHQMIGTEYRNAYILDWSRPYSSSIEDEVEAFNLLYTAAARASEYVFTVDRTPSGMCSWLPPEVDIPFEEMLDRLSSEAV